VLHSPPISSTETAQMRSLRSYDSHCNSVGTVTRLRTGRPGFDSQRRQGFFSLRHLVQTGSRVHPTSYPMDTGGCLVRVRRLVRETNHLLPSLAEVKNAWSYSTTASDVSMAWYLVKHRDNFCFCFVNIKQDGSVVKSTFTFI
jgi:hypothetical protein